MHRSTISAMLITLIKSRIHSTHSAPTSVSFKRRDVSMYLFRKKEVASRSLHRTEAAAFQQNAAAAPGGRLRLAENGRAAQSLQPFQPSISTAA
jgi:hypothetical protein